MKQLKTLRNFAGLSDNNVDWTNAAFVLIDFQNEYADGKLALGASGRMAIEQAKKLLHVARDHSAPIFHVVHIASEASSIFNPSSEQSQIIPQLQPIENEPIIKKSLPSSFYKTDLHQLLTLAGRKQLILAGFMSHMCITATTIQAVELGYEVIICEDACATRPLPGLNHTTLDANTIHHAAMAALNDRYATIRQLTALI
jgi:nicotinamidase-related amidase